MLGAVIVKDGEIIASAYNTRERSKCATHHAEILAIERACEALGGWRLPECTMYVTLEPCSMCAGGIINARIDRTVIALADAKSGALRSVINLGNYPLNHKTKTEFGLMENEARELMTEFFTTLRLKLRKNKANEM